ncbi:unnamed protein product [Pylaiella littoralis]
MFCRWLRPRVFMGLDDPASLTLFRERRPVCGPCTYWGLFVRKPSRTERADVERFLFRKDCEKMRQKTTCWRSRRTTRRSLFARGSSVCKVYFVVANMSHERLR